MSSAEPKSVRAVERAIDVLTSFDADHTVLEIGDLQRATGLTRPTLYRLLQALETKGFIHSHGTPKRFAASRWFRCRSRSSRTCGPPRAKPWP